MTLKGPFPHKPACDSVIPRCHSQQQQQEGTDLCSSLAGVGRARRFLLYRVQRPEPAACELLTIPFDYREQEREQPVTFLCLMDEKKINWIIERILSHLKWE